MSAVAFLQMLLSVSEKAANIARVIRSDQRLFQMLIEEKTGDGQNKRFVQDFKTLADVLIQETIKHDIGQQFPHMVDHIKGEESNKFTNTVGESICVSVKDTEEQTCDLLVTVLDGNSDAAQVLAKTVHSSSCLDVLSAADVQKLSELNFTTDNLGIWIDPIDGTAEYINGKQDVTKSNGIYPCGLQCCTVLIGAYDLTSGTPIVGIVNQPFETFNHHSNTWTGKAYWGISTPDGSSLSSITVPAVKPNKTIVISAYESETLKERLNKSNFTVVHSSGAGYKLLVVALGLADVYILSQGSTYKWDTCGPHSLLRAAGGDILNFKNIANQRISIAYNASNEDIGGASAWCNAGGLVAFTNQSVIDDLLKLL